MWRLAARSVCAHAPRRAASAHFARTFAVLPSAGGPAQAARRALVSSISNSSSRALSARAVLPYVALDIPRDEPQPKEYKAFDRTKQGRLVEVKRQDKRAPRVKRGQKLPPGMARLEPASDPAYYRQDICFVESAKGTLHSIVNAKGERSTVKMFNLDYTFEPHLGTPLLGAEGAAGGDEDEGGGEALSTAAVAERDAAVLGQWLGSVTQEVDGLVELALKRSVARAMWQQCWAAQGGAEVGLSEFAALLFGEAQPPRQAEGSEGGEGGSATAPEPPLKPILALSSACRRADNSVRQAAAAILLRTPLFAGFFDEHGFGFVPVSSAAVQRNRLLVEALAGRRDNEIFAKQVYHRILQLQGEGASQDLQAVRQAFPALQFLAKEVPGTGKDAQSRIASWAPEELNSVEHAAEAAAAARSLGKGGPGKGPKNAGLAMPHVDALRLQRLRLFSASNPFTRRRDYFANELFRRLGMYSPPDPLAVAQLLELAGLDEDRTLIGVRHQVELRALPLALNKREQTVAAAYLEAVGLEAEDSNEAPAAASALAHGSGGGGSGGGIEDIDEARRVDLTHLEVLAIDAAATRDVDDALSFEVDADGKEWVWVHIADVDRWVPAPPAGDRGSSAPAALHAMAQRRFESVYMPHRTYNMFPSAISTDPRLLTLGDGYPSDVLSFGMQVDADGAIASYEIVTGVVNNVKRGTYDAVNAFLNSNSSSSSSSSSSSGGGGGGGGGGAAQAAQPSASLGGWLSSFFASQESDSTITGGVAGTAGGEFNERQAQMLHALFRVAERRKRWRGTQGGQDLEIPNAEMYVMRGGAPLDAASEEEAAEDPWSVLGPDGTRIALKLDGPSPAQTLVSEMMIMTNELVGAHCANNGIHIPFRVQAPPSVSAEDLELIERLPSDPEVVRNWHRVRKMHPARCQLEPGWHSSLGLSSYSRGTSPIRRFWDLLVHHQVCGRLPLSSACTIRTHTAAHTHAQSPVPHICPRSSRQACVASSFRTPWTR